MTTDAERIIAAGVPVAIGDEELRLLFDFQSLEIIENEFGGLQPFATALNEGWDGPRMKACRVGLRAGLAHLEDPAANGPQAIRRLTSHLVGPGGAAAAERLAKAIADAWNQAVPPGSKASGKGSSRASGSHGDGSSTSPAKSSGKARVSSAG